MTDRAFGWQSILAVVLGAVIAGAVTYAVSEQVAPTYEASAIVIAPRSDTSTELSGTSTFVRAPLVASDYATAVMSQPVLAGALAGLGQMHPDQPALDHLKARTTSTVGGNLASAPTGDPTRTNLITVTVQGKSASFAAKAANAVAQSLIVWDSRRIRARLALVTRPVRAQLASRLVMPSASALSVLQPAELPTSPSSPLVARNALLAAVAGAALVLSLLIVLERRRKQTADPPPAYVPEDTEVRQPMVR